jgi:hemoglobin
MDEDRPKLRRPSQSHARSRGATSLYERMGGAVALRRLVRRFHELMETLPEAEAARAVLHVAPSDLGPKLYEFLSGWLGGPELYAKRHGSPKLKRRHFLVPIGPAQRDGWLLCFRRAAEETIADAAVLNELLPQIESLAHYLAERD